MMSSAAPSAFSAEARARVHPMASTTVTGIAVYGGGVFPNGSHPPTLRVPFVVRRAGSGYRARETEVLGRRGVASPIAR